MPELAFIIVSHNRRDRLAQTLARLDADHPPAAGRTETWVVDNASSDGTPDMLRAGFPHVRLIERAANEGVGARTHAMLATRAPFQMLLDDDSYPLDNTAARSVAYLKAHPHCGAVGGRCELPDGRTEACALPGVLISCAVCLRSDAAHAVGGFRPEFFRKGGEYDFSFRLLQAGYGVARFEDLRYRHDKFLAGRSSALATRMDVRNNLLLAERFLPRAHRRAYRSDWLRRYALLARHAGQTAAARAGVQEARAMAAAERAAGRQTLSGGVLETLFQWDTQSRAVTAFVRRHALQRVLLADLSKNLYATCRACRHAGVAVAGVLDPHPAFAGSRYRGLPVTADPDALPGGFDGIVLSSVSPARVEAARDALRRAYDLPLLTLWSGTRLDRARPALEIQLPATPPAKRPPRRPQVTTP